MRKHAPFRRLNSRLVGASFLVERWGATPIEARWARQAKSSQKLLADVLESMMLGRRQVVRHRSLDPAFVGSNPSAPANFTCPTNFRFVVSVWLFYLSSTSQECQTFARQRQAKACRT